MDRKTLTYNNRPEFGLEVSIFDLSTTWNETDITQYIQNAYNNSETEVSFGLKVLNGEAISTSQVEIYPRETSSTNLNNSPNAAYIKLQGAIDSELQLDHNQQIKGSAGSIITLTKVHLQMSASTTHSIHTMIIILFYYRTLTRQWHTCTQRTSYDQVGSIHTSGTGCRYSKIHP